MKYEKAWIFDGEWIYIGCTWIPDDGITYEDGYGYFTRGGKQYRFKEANV